MPPETPQEESPVHTPTPEPVKTPTPPPEEKPKTPTPTPTPTPSESSESSEDNEVNIPAASVLVTDSKFNNAAAKTGNVQDRLMGTGAYEG